jgi:hypothetical protein
MGIASPFHHQGALGATNHQRRTGSSLRIELAVGLLLASAIVAFGLVAYFTFAPLVGAP